VIAFFFPFKPIVLPAFLAGVPVVVPAEVEVFVEGISVEVDWEEEPGVGVGVDDDDAGVEAELKVAERVELKRGMVGWSISTYPFSLLLSFPVPLALAVLLRFRFGVDVDVGVDDVDVDDDPPILIFSKAILFNASSLNPPSSPFSSPCACPIDFSLFRFFTPSPHASPIPKSTPTPAPKPVPLPSPPAARSCALCNSSPGVLFAWVKVD
jgi:hypothetical protein